MHGRELRRTREAFGTLGSTTRVNREAEAVFLSGTHLANDLQQLQRTVGNQAVLQMLREDRGPMIQRTRGGKKGKGGGGRGDGGKKKTTPQNLTPKVDGVNVINIGPVVVDYSTRMTRFYIDNNVYHLNVDATATKHVTWEKSPKEQYFFELDGLTIRPCRPEDSESGRYSHMFNALPKKVQRFVEENYSSLL